jgi:hypothetical protein
VRACGREVVALHPCLPDWSLLRCALCWQIPDRCTRTAQAAVSQSMLTGAPRWQAKMFTTLWMWRQEYQHHEQLPLAFNGTWPSWNSDLDNRPW